MSRRTRGTLWACGLAVLLWGAAACESPTRGATASEGDSEESGGATTAASEGATMDADTSAGSESGASSDTEGATTGPAIGDCEPGGSDASDPFVDCVAGFEPDAGAKFGHADLPDVVMGPPLGKGNMAGSLDVASLGCGGVIELFFDDPIIADGEGPDFIVFENPWATSTGDPFVEPARVSVSEDGETWHAFTCDVGEGDPSGCAGVTPVHAHPDNEISPTDPEVAGGDAFDLADVGLARARYVRIEDLTREHYEDDMWCAGIAGGFDLDAAAIVNEVP